MKNNTYLTIITLTKNNYKEFLRTLESIFSQKNTINIEWLIIDGSNQKTQNKIKKLIEKYLKNYQKKNILIKHIDSVKNQFNDISLYELWEKNCRR